MASVGLTYSWLDLDVYMSRGSPCAPTLHVVACSAPSTSLRTDDDDDSSKPDFLLPSSPSTKTMVAGQGRTGRRGGMRPPSPPPLPPFGSLHDKLICWPGSALSDHTQLSTVNMALQRTCSHARRNCLTAPPCNDHT